MPKIYTRTGDSGESSTANGRVRKAALVFDVLGTLDELNSWIGWIRTSGGMEGRANLLESIQRALMALSADVAGYGAFATDLIPVLEGEIDRMSPPGEFRLRLPAGGGDVARAVCRRAERVLIAYSPAHRGVPFLNRLSDYLFVIQNPISV